SRDWSSDVCSSDLDHLAGGEAGAAHVAAGPVDAVGAVVDAEVRQQDLEQRYAAAVGRIRVADAHALGAADALRAARVATPCTAGGAGGVVLGRVSEDRQLVGQLHAGTLAGTRLSW